MKGLSATMAGAFTGGYVALIVRGRSMGDAVADLGRDAWSAAPTTSLADVAHLWWAQSAWILVAALVGAGVAGFGAARLGRARRDRPSRFVALVCAIAAIAVGAALFRNLVRLVALDANGHASPLYTGRALLGELRWLGGWMVALAVDCRDRPADRDLASAGDRRRTRPTRTMRATR